MTALARYWDPAGARYGIPTYPWGLAPPHLATRRQLGAWGLRPAGQDVQAQVLWTSHRTRARVRAAYLYDVRLALPKRTATPAQLDAVAKAVAARRHCPRCDRDAGYVLPRRLGVCLTCATDWEVNAA